MRRKTNEEKIRHLNNLVDSLTSQLNFKSRKVDELKEEINEIGKKNDYIDFINNKTFQNHKEAIELQAKAIKSHTVMIYALVAAVILMIALFSKEIAEKFKK